MTGILVCLSAAALGVDYGWQPVAGGGIEYIIQIEPQMLDALKSGHDIFSDLPGSVRQVRSYRITVGTARLPHHGEPPPESAVVPAGGPVSESPADDDAGAETNDIDLSQLPGPVLRPALTLEDPRVAGHEPRRIAADAEPLNSRVAGYHSKSSGADDSSPNEAEHREAATAAPHVERTEPQKPASNSKTPTDTEVHAQAKKEDSPSDHKPGLPVAPPLKPSLMQVGLFASLGCNAFLFWVATGQRSRYRALARRMFEGAAPAPAADALMDAGQTSLPRWEQLPIADKEAKTGGLSPPSDQPRPEIS
ncbi:MAG TPA: hypothetical protein VNH11_35040 [Pirellulales bacterium]|nr:hypothetical protein [Pirellulales bacterium]